MRFAAGALLVLLVATECSHASPRPTPPTPRDQGRLNVYVRPWPQDAARLSFRIDDLSAVRDDGALIPLELKLTEASARNLTRERLLAAAALPPGGYSGLSLRASKASLDRAEGSAALQTPDAPARIDFPFKIDTQHAVLVSLQLDYQASMGPGFQFTPAFAGVTPPVPAPDLVGLASSRGSDTVTLFDKSSGRVAGVVRTGRRPTGLALDPARRRVYVAGAGDDAIESIGLLEQAVLDRVVLRSDDEPVELALTPGGNTLLCVNRGSSTVSLIDAVPLVETVRLPVGSAPSYVLVDKDGARAWVFNTGESTLTVIDLAARAVAGTVSTDAGPVRGEFDRDGKILYVIHRSSPYLALVDPLSLSVTRRVYVGAGATALKVDSRTDRIYLAIRGAAALEVYDRLSLLPADSITTDGDVSFLAIDDQGYNLYIVLPREAEVQVVRLVSKETTTRVDVGDDPYGVVLLGER